MAASAAVATSGRASRRATSAAVAIVASSGRATSATIMARGTS